jgi:hypothetical protein
MTHQRNPGEGSPERNEPSFRFRFLPRPVQGHDEFHFAVLSPQAAKRAEQFSNGLAAILRSQQILGPHHPESEIQSTNSAQMGSFGDYLIGIAGRASVLVF